jgi:hypothetical protein
MRLKFERCTASCLEEMFTHYFDMDLPEEGACAKSSIKTILMINKLTTHIVLLLINKESIQFSDQ